MLVLEVLQVIVVSISFSLVSLCLSLLLLGKGFLESVSLTPLTSSQALAGSLVELSPGLREDGSFVLLSSRLPLGSY
jgi:hypothetical protein